MVENLVGIELAYINTKHPDFHEAGYIHRALTSDDSSVNAHHKSKHDSHVSMNKH